MNKWMINLMLLLMLLSTPIFAWDQAGHRIIAHIAYQHLNPKAKRIVDLLTAEETNDNSGLNRFMYISNWADWERARGNNVYNSWHYIDLPYADTGLRPRAPDAQNVVYGINNCVTILRQPLRTTDAQRVSLKLLVHLVGDIHQPLHNISRYNVKHPGGDHGGNAYVIHSKTATNLHAYWDLGLGEFRRFQPNVPNANEELLKYAKSIEERYPPTYFVRERLSTKPIEWAYEGHDISKLFIYNLSEYAKPSRNYHYEGKQIMEQRIAIAAYRLATLLNQIYA